jgi:hypothetical protein
MAPVVLTAQPDAYEVLNQTLMEDVPTGTSIFEWRILMSIACALPSTDLDWAS